jgi:hypothetical protein
MSVIGLVGRSVGLLVIQTVTAAEREKVKSSWIVWHLAVAAADRVKCIVANWIGQYASWITVQMRSLVWRDQAYDYRSLAPRQEIKSSNSVQQIQSNFCEKWPEYYILWTVSAIKGDFPMGKNVCPCFTNAPKLLNSENSLNLSALSALKTFLDRVSSTCFSLRIDITWLVRQPSPLLLLLLLLSAFSMP